ncbi:MAG: AEC family transporter, partial [Acutalibacteraceae bacterium]
VEPVELISALNTPLAMIVVGGYIAQVKLRAFVSDLAVYRMAALRLVVLPLLYLAVVWLARPNDTLLMSTAIQGATPVAANCVLFAVQYGSDAELASKSVAVTTALSVITIPLIAVLVQVLL